jgi:hypothetical protein
MILRKALLIILVTFGISIHAYSFYTLTDLTDLIEKSDFIVYGEIHQIGTLNIKIILHDKIKGEIVSDTLQFRKFSNWSCASRYENYEIGQEAIFFLKRHKDNRIYGMGAGNEGEMLVKNDTAYFEDFKRNTKGGQKVEYLNPYVKYLLFDVNVVITGLRIYLDNLEIIQKEYLIPNPGTVICFNYEVQKLSQNEFYQFALRQKQLKPIELN